MSNTIGSKGFNPSHASHRADKGALNASEASATQMPPCMENDDQDDQSPIDSLAAKMLSMLASSDASSFQAG